jgi:Lrp/AsnC family leucine-responsive transcriptional regulator
MENDKNTWVIEGDTDHMLQDVNGKRLFTYKTFHEEINTVNMRILEELQRDPRVTMSELGRRVGMSSPAVTERVRRLEEAGVIRGYCLDLNPTALGLPIAAYVRIRPNPGQLPRIVELAQQLPEVVECHRVTGEDCFILKVYMETIPAKMGNPSKEEKSTKTCSTACMGKSASKKTMRREKLGWHLLLWL